MSTQKRSKEKRTASVASVKSLVNFKPARGSRTLAKDENLQPFDRCFICGGLADLVTRRGSRYRPICLDCAPSKQGALARAVEVLITKHEADELDETASEVAQLISGLLFDLGNETQIFATHPKLIRRYMMLMLEALPTLKGRDRTMAEQSFGEVSELLEGCSQKRFRQIDRRHNGAEPIKKACNTVPREVRKLKDALSKLERVPENEAIYFQLESEISRLEQENERDKEVDEWPDVIGN
jgi:hypothetical protein